MNWRPRHLWFFAPIVESKKDRESCRSNLFTIFVEAVGCRDHPGASDLQELKAKKLRFKSSPEWSCTWCWSDPPSCPRLWSKLLSRGRRSPGNNWCLTMNLTIFFLKETFASLPPTILAPPRLFTRPHVQPAWQSTAERGNDVTTKLDEFLERRLWSCCFQVIKVQSNHSTMGVCCDPPDDSILWLHNVSPLTFYWIWAR